MFGSGDIFGSESPKKDIFDDGTPGTGKYPAKRIKDATLEDHTIYVPITPPPTDVKLPVLIFGNGGCGNTGSAFTNLLTEIASHGYIVVANGAPITESTTPKGAAFDWAGIFKTGFKQSSVKQMTDAVDWVTKGGASKYGNIDVTKIAVGGQSCGGLQAYSASYHDDRIKLTILFNSGVIEDSKAYLLKELKAPVAYIIGGPKDIAYNNVNNERFLAI
jgi:dienelactone hydrolase